MSSKLCHALNYRIIIDLSFHFLYAVQHSIQINSKTVSCRQQPTPLPMVTPIESRVLTYQWHLGSFYNNLLSNQSSQLSGRLHMSPNQCQRQFEANRSRFASYNETLLCVMCLLLDSTSTFRTKVLDFF